MVDLVMLSRIVEPVNVLEPEKVLLFERRVDEAAVMVISEVPSNETLLMFLAV